MLTKESAKVERMYSCLYTWYTGPIIGKFLTELRDNKRVMGVRCPICSTVFVPAVDLCPKCFQPLSEWVEVKDEGVLTGYTMVFNSFPNAPAATPYIVGFIKLDGSDTRMVHLVKAPDELFLLKSGLRVKAVWNEERKGDIKDIKYFELVGV